MVRDDQDGPAFIEKMDELPQIIVGLDIDVLHEFEVDFFGQLGVIFFLHVPNEGMLLQVNIVEMGEDDVVLLFFDQIVERIGLPLRRDIPRCQHTVGGQHGVRHADHGRRRDRAEFARHFVEEFLRMPDLALGEIHGGGDPDAYGAAVFG